MNKPLLTIIILVCIPLILLLYSKLSKENSTNRILIFLVGLTIAGTIIYLIWFPGDKWNSQNYFMGISQMLGGLFTVIGVYFTIKEEEKLRKDDEEKSKNEIKEQMRLQNLPVLKFTCNNKQKVQNGQIYYVDCVPEDETYKIQLNIEIKNIGLGAAQNIWFQKIIGIENDNIISRIENQIIIPKDSISYTMYFEIPKNKKNFYKRLTILVFYNDLLDNKYMQKLDGSLSVSCCETNGTIEYYPNVLATANESYIRIENDFKYEIPQEVIEDEIIRIEHEEKQKKINENIPNRKLIDNIITDYLKEQKTSDKIIKENFKWNDFKCGSGGIDNYKLISKNNYEVNVVEKMGFNRREYIIIETRLIVNIKTEVVKCIDKEVIKCTLNIKNRELKKLNKVIKKELKLIKKCEEEKFTNGR